MKRRLIQLLKLALVAVIVYFVADKLAANWHEVSQYPWRFNWLLMAVAVLAQVLTFALQAYVWALIIRGFGYRIRLGPAFKISYIANLGRYLPGKIWPVFGMLYYARRIGLAEQAAVASWALAQLFAIPAALLVATLCFLIDPGLFSTELQEQLGGSAYVAALLFIGISLFMVFWPNHTLSLFNRVLLLFKRQPVTFRLSVGLALSIYLGYALAWCLFGVSFWLFISATAPEASVPLPAAMGSFLLAYQIGYLTLLTPGGLGVREWVLTSMLSKYLGPIAAGISVAARIWNIAAEIVAALIALAIPLDSTDKSA